MYATAVNTRASVMPYRARSVYGRRARLGQTEAGQLIGTIGGTAANAIAPGSGAIVAPVIDSIAQLFGGNPATGANAERQAHIDTVYEQAMTSPGSSSSIAAVVELYTISLNLYDPVNNVQQNNPQATRTYAQEALNVLASQGWSNIGLSPVYTGVYASGEVLGVNSATGAQGVVANRALPSSVSSLLSSPLGLLAGAAVVGGLVYLLVD